MRNKITRRMKLRASVIGVIILFAFLATKMIPDVDPAEKEKIVLDAVMKYIDQLHFSPTELNDETSEVIFTDYLSNLDASKRFLIQEDIDKLSAYIKQVDNDIIERKFDFFNASVEVVNNARQRAERIFKEVNKGELNHDDPEILEIDGEKRKWSKDENELKEYWRQLIEYDVLNRYTRNKKNQDSTEVKSDTELLSVAKEKSTEQYERWFNNLNKQRRVDLFSTYLNSILGVFDPHTGYFKPKDKQDFNLRMSGTLEGIGARLSTDKDYTKVVSIVPGGPAWKQGELKANDLILKVAQEGEEPIDVTGWNINDVVSKIRGKKGTKVILSVKSINGEFHDVEIVRDVVIFEETYAKSVIIHDSLSQNKIGYIDLPSFYAKFGTKDGRSSAKDINAELIKLRSENVDGVIFDLRNNGGGSLNDVVDIAGMFIEKGPVVQVKARNRSPQVLNDKDPETVYDGPLVVVVNEFSASASEILAAALQDYERAIIIGTPTFGKGTVQRFYNLDKSLRENKEIKPLGEVKITIQNFYRINGGSTQLRGVTPDIILPDNYQHFEMGERDYDHVLDWTEIDPLEYSQNIYKVSNLKYVHDKSNDRVDNHPVFNLIRKNARRLKDNSDQTSINLEIVSFEEELDKKEEEGKPYKDFFTPLTTFSVSNLSADVNHIQSDTSRIARNEAFFKSIQKDIYLEEALAVMNDMIHGDGAKVTKAEKEKE
jgi:carboxyl-terminal processing protease